MRTIIIGAGGHSLSVLEILHFDPGIKIMGFLDNDEKLRGKKMDRDAVVEGDITEIHELIRKGTNSFIVAIGDNEVRKKYFADCLKLGLIPINAIHTKATISHNAKSIGTGVFIGANAYIGPEVSVGNNVIINNSVVLPHNNTVEDNVNISPGVNVGGGSVIKEGSFIGIGTSIIQYITIGRNVTIGAGAAIVCNIPDNVIAFGVPCKVIKNREAR